MPDLIERLQALLTAAGWTPLDGTAIACKNFPTVVGLKQALAYVADLGPATTRVWLYADYQSEGRNVCESGGVLIPKAGEVDLADHVHQFLATIAKTIEGSYAARLLRTAA